MKPLLIQASLLALLLCGALCDARFRRGRMGFDFEGESQPRLEKSRTAAAGGRKPSASEGLNLDFHRLNKRLRKIIMGTDDEGHHSLFSLEQPA